MKKQVSFTYRTKLLASFVLVLAIPILLAGSLGRYWAKESAIHEVRLRLNETANGLQADISKREDRLLKMAWRLSRDERLRKAVRSGRREEILNLLTRLYDAGDFDVIEVGDSAGRVWARGHNPPDFGEDKSSQNIIATALAGETAADIERGVSGIGVRAVAPIFAPDETRPVATVMLGDAIDSNFLARYARITGVDIALFEGEKLITTTVPALAGIFSDPRPGGIFRNGDAAYDVSLSPLHRRAGSPFGTIVVARNRAEVERFLDGASRAVWIALGAGFALASVLAASLVRLFSKPVENLQKAMRTVENGQSIDAILVTQDDEFGKLEQQFNRMAEKLRETSRKVDRMQRERVRLAQRSVANRILAEVAHEIRNPLNAMAAQIELIRTSGSAGGTNHLRRADILSEEIRRLDRTVQDLITQAGPMRLERSAADLRTIVESILSLFEKEIKSKEIVVMRYYGERLTPLRLDGQRIHQALMNLILNAIQSMECCGILSVEISDLNGRVRVSISDSGVGMPPKELEEIFDTYYTTKKEGTGIGLSVALRIIEAHDGSIEVESEPGKGTRVSVFLPGETEKS